MSVVDTSITFLSRELEVFVRFTGRDWSATLIPGFIIALGAVKRAALPTLAVIQFLPWVSAYIYFFNLSNQITGVEEDRINKPDRPIPAGKVTLEGARCRWYLALASFVAIAAWNGSQLPETMAWVAVTAFLCLTPGGGHWFAKNMIGMTIGSWALLNGVYKSVAMPTMEEERFFLVLSVWGGIALQIQDLRDVLGDRATGRRTLPIVAGEKWCRWIITLVVLPLGCWVLWIGEILSKAPLLLTSAHAVLGYRVMRGKGARCDHKTYMVRESANWILFCAILALQLVGRYIAICKNVGGTVCHLQLACQCTSVNM